MSVEEVCNEVGSGSCMKEKNSSDHDDETEPEQVPSVLQKRFVDLRRTSPKEANQTILILIIYCSV